MVRKRLMVTSETIFQELIEKATKLFRLDEAGNCQPLVDISKLSNKQKVEFHLLAAHMASMGKLRASGNASDKEMAGFMGLTPAEVQRRVHDLKNEGKVDGAGKGEYHLVPGRIGDVLRDLGAQ